MVDPVMVSRRRALQLLAAAPFVVAAACSDDGSDDRAREDVSPENGGSLEPTPACGDDPTAAQTEGPFFSEGSPERSSLREAGVTGTPLVVEGTVVTTTCTPIDRSRIDFWQTDDAGEYDNDGFRLRGHLFTDASGRFRLETIVPGLYQGRTRHIHAIVQSPGAATLTTQLYFPDEPGNADDGIFDERLLMTMSEADDGSRLGTFDFVLEV